MGFQEQAQFLKEQVDQASLDGKKCRIIAVTKYVDAETTRRLVEETGFHHLGENRVPQFLAKKEELKYMDLTWHFIGSLQRRKVKEVINEMDYFHGLDSIRLAEEIQKRAKGTISCFLQVNLSRESNKHGFFDEEISDALAHIQKLDKIKLVGIMTMAPLGASDDQLDRLFAEAEALRQKLASQKIPRMPFSELSMGMSSDYQRAIQNGATFVRIGSLLFE